MSASDSDDDFVDTPAYKPRMISSQLSCRSLPKQKKRAWETADSLISSFIDANKGRTLSGTAKRNIPPPRTPAQRRLIKSLSPRRTGSGALELEDDITDVVVGSEVLASEITVQRKRLFKKALSPEPATLQSFGLDAMDAAAPSTLQGGEQPVCDRDGRMGACSDAVDKSSRAISDVLHILQTRVATKGQIAHVKVIPPRSASYGKLPPERLQKRVNGALKSRGVTQLYSHQAEAISSVFDGNSVVAATPTASGKSMVYTIPVLDSLVSIRGARALYIFPLKALARDQLKALRTYIAGLHLPNEVVCESFDGDTPFEERKRIQSKAQIVLTNPEMLHRSILPNHKNWATFFKKLTFVVIDEAHSFRGVFGSHVACILRRLLRICRLYKSQPQFICCSATIANPQEHTSLLTSVDMKLVEGSGAPTGPKTVVCWQPPMMEGAKDGGSCMRPSYLEAVDILVALANSGLQTLCFVPARKLTEMVCNILRSKLDVSLNDKVESYRAGYTAAERQHLEQRFASGQLLVLVATSALELGIDIGALDATVHVGIPDTVASLRQQMGRAGRRDAASLAVVVASDRPLDQHYMRHPGSLFSKPVEQALLDPSNEYLLKLHLPCAAKEIALTDEDAAFFGTSFLRLRDELTSKSTLVYDRFTNAYFYGLGISPSEECTSLRGRLSDDFYKVLDEQDNVVEEVDSAKAFSKVHKGAILLHGRDTYEIMALDIPNKIARAEKADRNFSTEAQEKLSINLLEVYESKVVCGTRVYRGEVEVEQRVSGYVKKRVFQNKVEETKSLNLPPVTFTAPAMWWDVPAAAEQKLDDAGLRLMAAMAAVQNATAGLVPLFAMCDTGDYGSLAVRLQPESNRPQTFVFDAHPGGVGVSHKVYDQVEELWSRVLQTVQECPCETGCPSCVQWRFSAASEEDTVGAKEACLALLELILSGEYVPQEGDILVGPVLQHTAAAKPDGKGPLPLAAGQAFAHSAGSSTAGSSVGANAYLQLMQPMPRRRPGGPASGNVPFHWAAKFSGIGAMTPQVKQEQTFGHWQPSFKCLNGEVPGHVFSGQDGGNAAGIGAMAPQVKQEQKFGHGLSPLKCMNGEDPGHVFSGQGSENAPAGRSHSFVNPPRFSYI